MTRDAALARGDSGLRECRIMPVSAIDPRKYFMRRLAHKITVLLVLYHATVGCCWHHAHAAPLEPGRAGVKCCDHKHGHNEEQAPTPQPHPPGGGCDGENCDFVIPQVDAGTELVEQSASTDALCCKPSCATCACAKPLSHESPPPVGRPPLRLHLMNQILLI